jgi:hypothetical protein
LWATVHAWILGVRFLRRHPLALALALAVLVSALMPLPELVDAVTGSPAGDAQLVHPFWYVVGAPLSDTLDALTFLSLSRAWWFLGSWIGILAFVAVLRAGSRWRRIFRIGMGVLLPVGFAVAAVLLPRPVPRLVTLQSGVDALDFHSHTEASHDGRHGWTPERLAWWHWRQGFQAAYVTDHNIPFDQNIPDAVIPLLPGVEWSVYRQHIITLGAVDSMDLGPYSKDTPSMVNLFAALHNEGALAIASLPEYWRNHWDDLDLFVAGGVDGFEIVTCAPKALGFPSADRRQVVDLARHHDLLVTGASDNHGWGMVTCVWNIAQQGAHGFADNQVVARPIALVQGDLPAWSAAYSQLWLMFRGLTWPERISWLTWIALIAIYRGMPRRKGQAGGIGILARELGHGRRP